MRGTSNKRNGLILHKPDKDDGVFVSALVLRERLPIVTLRGWLYAWEGKQDRFWGQGKGGKRPCYFADPLILHDMRDLPSL